MSAHIVSNMTYFPSLDRAVGEVKSCLLMETEVGTFSKNTLCKREITAQSFPRTCFCAFPRLVHNSDFPSLDGVYSGKKA